MKIKLTRINKSEDISFEGERLIFTKTMRGHFTIENKDYELLGKIEKVRVGTWMHWCLFLYKDCYLSPGCNDEAREMQRLLGSISKSNTEVKA